MVYAVFHYVPFFRSLAPRYLPGFEKDGDIISLNLNGEWIVRGLEVTKAGAKIRVPLIHKKNHLIMHAENLGSIPPNTASMKLNDGTKVHEITLNSDAGKSEGILFVRP